MEAVVRAVRERCRVAGISPPTANTVRARIRRLRADKAARARESASSAASRRLTPAAGQTPPAERPMTVLQIDHTPVDLILVDETWRKPVGRPWLSVAIDACSRCIAGGRNGGDRGTIWCMTLVCQTGAAHHGKVAALLTPRTTGCPKAKRGEQEKCC